VDAASVSRIRRSQAFDQLFYAKPSLTAFDDKWDLHDYAADHIGVSTRVTYLEFGVASGDSLRRAAARFTNPRTSLIGFDSFFGLPEDWYVGSQLERVIPRGTFSQHGKLPEFTDDRVSLVPGWFQNTVPEFFAEQKPDLSDGAVLVHFDADLYSSTLFLLTSIWPHISEYYFLMDDFSHDDIIALHDFTKAYPVSLDWLAHCKNPADVPTQVYGKMKRVAFQLGADAIVGAG